MRHLFEFEDFRLDLAEKTLTRGGAAVPVTPKAFDTLRALVESAGSLVEKDELMRRVWQGRFVEESNLTFNIKVLRKALGDDAARPRFIETVPRRGYRFIAAVSENVNGNGKVPSSAGAAEGKAADRHKSRWMLAAVSALLILIAAIGGLWYARSGGSKRTAPILSAEFSSEQLSVDGKVRNAAISPDGRNVVYTYEADGKSSVWLRELESSTNVQIIPPSAHLYLDLVVAPDGRTLYLARVQQPWPAGVQPDLYRVSIFGGVPTRIVTGAQGSISVSPDGTWIAFRRCPYTDEEYCSLWTADADGTNEKKLLSRPSPIRLGDQEISADGKTIAFAVGQSRNWANDFGLAEIDVATMTEHEITQEKFFDIRRMAWLPDGGGLLLAAKRYPDKNFRIWKLDRTTGRSAVLTNDAESYVSLSLSSDAGALVSTKHRPDYRLNIYDSGVNGGRPRTLAEASAVAFASDEKIVFASAMTGNHEISTVNLDGSEQRQLTNNPAVDLNGIVSKDKSLIFFDSNRTGEAQVWRMNADGTDQRQLTTQAGGSPLLAPPDGIWVYFVSAKDKKLMRVPVDGGEEELVWDKSYNHHFALSPDASMIAFSEPRDKGTAILVVSLADKRTVRAFDVPNEKTGVLQSAWSADGGSLFYVAQDEKNQNYFVWKQPLNARSPVKVMDLGPEELRETRAFAVSPDGRRFAAVQGSWKHDAVLLKGLR